MNIADEAAIRKEIISILSGFRYIGLAEMERVHLMSRFDSKYVFHLSKLPEYLSKLSKDYETLRIDDLPLFRYENLYFDTSALKSYHDHHNGKSTRFKVRFRKYADTNRCFIEVKQKTNKGMTSKARLACDNITRSLTEPQLEFLKSQLGEYFTMLQPQLANEFYRTTLVNEEQRERVTIDLLIHFKNGVAEKFMDELVIAEVKQEHQGYHSAFKQLMQHERIFPTSISKYCIGTVLTHPGIKYNTFKPKLLTLNKICNGVV